MDRRAAWVLGLIFGGLFLSLFGFLFLLWLSLDGSEGRPGSGPRVGVVELVGAISDSKRVLKELKEYEKDDDIKAVVVRIDSPGGAVGPSQEIHDAILRLKAKKKVVASMGSMAASGGYYVACAADRVFANPGTLTGSIGVIMQIPNVSGLLRWANVEMTTVTAGKMKDAGSPFRQMSSEERQYFESMLGDVHSQFIEAVAKGRGMQVDEVRPLADGRVFSGRQAKELKLVDELGGIEAAASAAAKLAGVEGEPEMQYPRRERRLLRELMGEDAEAMVGGALRQTVRQVVGGGLEYRLPMAEVH